MSLAVAINGKTKEHVTCTRDYVQIGCYENVHKLLTQFLVTDRDIASKYSTGHLIDWRSYALSLHSLACRCSEKARKLNLKYFGIRFYGECYGGNDILALHEQMREEDMTEKSSHVHCINGEYAKCNSIEKECAGTHLGEYVYEITYESKKVVHGGFSEWSEFGDCSSECNVGVEIRERKCNNPEPKGEGAKDCSEIGPYTESRPCKMVQCDKPTVWSNWTPCSKSCNSGFTMRTMGCNSHRTRCVGSESEITECNTHDCSDVFPIGVNWSNWSACSQSCGDGKRYRKRFCNSDTIKLEGKLCADYEQEEMICHLQDCQVNGQ